jgi:hypothetical protein
MKRKKTTDAAIAIVAAVSAAALAACSPTASGDLGDLQSLAKTCPAHELVEYDGYDVSGSGQSPAVTSARLAALKTIATKVAVCNGHLRVDAFTGSAAASTVVFDQNLTPAGATQIAKLRKVDSLVAADMKKITAGIAHATTTLATDGSDITAQFGLAAEYGKQMAASGPVSLSIDLQTDGVQTVGVVLNTRALTTSSAADLANRAPAVALPVDTRVTVSGLGKTAGTPPPTSYVDAIKAFYLAYCRHTGAANCVAVTDYTS